MKNIKITVKTKSKPYPIYLGDRVINSTGMLINKNLNNAKKICIICDKNVPSFLLKKLTKSIKRYDYKIYMLSAGEKTKNFRVAQKLIENLLKYNLNRSDCIIALGGGVILDLSAFVASLTKRGIKLINIPTTLLAQVDASIGGKTAINSKQGKNLIGTFYQPDFVIIDISFLNSLPRREMICGYGEILKHSLILNNKFFLWLTKNAKKIINYKNKKLLKIAVTESCRIKSRIVSKDEKEGDLRKILNFGHTFAHGFEGAKNFSNKLNHGEAVLLGMMMAIKLAYKKKLLPQKDLILIKKHYINLNFPMKLKKIFRKKEINKIISFMERDKKNSGKKINLILIKKIGKVIKPDNINIKSDELKKFLLSNYI